VCLGCVYAPLTACSRLAITNPKKETIERFQFFAERVKMRFDKAIAGKAWKDSWGAVDKL
jgi:hypothetical protein